MVGPGITVIGVVVVTIVAQAVAAFRRLCRIHIGGSRPLQCGATAAGNGHPCRQYEQRQQGGHSGAFLFFVQPYAGIPDAKKPGEAHQRNDTQKNQKHVLSELANKSGQVGIVFPCEAQGAHGGLSGNGVDAHQGKDGGC